MHNWIIQSVPLIQSISFSCLTTECCPALYFYLTSTNWPALVTDNPLSETNGSPSLTTKNVQISTIRKTWDSNFHQSPKVSKSDPAPWWPTVLCIIYLNRRRCMTFKFKALSRTSFSWTNWVCVSCVSVNLRPENKIWELVFLTVSPNLKWYES